MIFNISTIGDKTIVHFIHEGITPKKECFAMCEKGWTIIINNWLYYFTIHDIASPEMSKADEIRTKNLIDNDKTK